MIASWSWWDGFTVGFAACVLVSRGWRMLSAYLSMEE